jgi:hypothetical protein
MAFREKDFIKRQLAEVARAIARALGLKEEGRPDEARAVLESGTAAALGVGYASLGAVDVATALGLLRTREAAEGYAQLLECDASLQDDGGDSARAESLRARAQAIRAGATSYIAPGFPTTRRNIES